MSGGLTPWNMEYGVKLYIEIEQEKLGELNMKKEMVQAYI